MRKSHPVSYTHLFFGIFLAVIVIIQTVIALGLRLILAEFQVGKCTTAYKQGKQKTAYEIMSGDWSSDVCSSDL